MRTMGRDQEIPVALPPHVPQPPDEHAWSERYGLTMWLQEGCSVEEYQEIAAKLETYAASIIVGCEQKPYASLDAGSANDTAAPARAHVAVKVTLYMPPRHPGIIEMTVYDNLSDMTKGLKSLDARIKHCTLTGYVTDAGLGYADEAKPENEQ